MRIKIRIVNYLDSYYNNQKLTLYLYHNNWDDFGFRTTYDVNFTDENGQTTKLGNIKIGEFNMQEPQRSPDIEVKQSIERLGKQFFSLGQDDSYYENIKNLGDRVRVSILEGLNDIAYNLELFNKCINEDVTQISLLRGFSQAVVREQFHRIATGGEKLTPYNFAYMYADSDEEVVCFNNSLTFEVKPDSTPPTNIHVLIGSNGVGKSCLLKSMINSLLGKNIYADKYKGDFAGISKDINYMFANMIYVAFSAFEEFCTLDSYSIREYAHAGLPCTRIGLMKDDASLYTPNELSIEFIKSLKSVFGMNKEKLWINAIEMLESDPLFKEYDITTLFNYYNSDRSFTDNAKEIFAELSSGHKVIILTITKLVETVMEGSLVLMDEPEGHLHPPLLSAFIRALSNLLSSKNGVAIIATHSPVILQEVPKSCVWKLFRSGKTVIAERPHIECFGENVGSLTSEVFRLEVMHSGFYKILKDKVMQSKTYSEILSEFNYELGMEARAILRSLIATNNSEEGD